MHGPQEAYWSLTILEGIPMVHNIFEIISLHKNYSLKYRHGWQRASPYTFLSKH